MKHKLLTILFGLALTGTSWGVGTLTIREFNETLVADFNGVPVPLTLTGPVDGWTIQLPTNYSLSMLGEVRVGEPENAGKMNSILVGTQPTFLTWTSDINIIGGPYATTVTLLNAGTERTAGSFTLVLQDGIPDVSSTITLLGIGLVGLSSVRFAIRRKDQT